MSQRTIEILDDLITRYKTNIIRMKDAQVNLGREVQDYEYDIHEMEIAKQRISDQMRSKGYNLN